MKIFKNIKLNDGDKRSVLVKKNIFASLLIKGVSMIASFILVPITLNYLDVETYGVWLTMSSILMWIAYCDVGLGNGMRNYLTTAIAIGDMALAKKYISTTFLLLSAIAFIMALGSIIGIPQIDMQWLFNTKATSPDILTTSMIIAVLMTLALFVVRNIGMVFTALQLSAINDILLALGNILSLIILWNITLFTEPNLLNVVAVFTVTPVAIFVIAAIPTFVRYKQLRPSFRDIDFGLSRQIVGKGLGFFVLQIAGCIVIYGASNVIITRYCGPAEVTNYGIAYRFFNLLSIVYIIFLTPFWSAYTDAYAKKDYDWINRMFSKTMKVWALLSALGVLMLIIAPLFYHIWVGDTVKIDFTLSAAILFYVCMFNLNSGITYFINGLNKIRVQIICTLTVTTLYIITILLIGGKFGVEGIVISMGVSYMLMSAVHLYQSHLLTKGKATGIWNK